MRATKRTVAYIGLAVAAAACHGIGCSRTSNASSPATAPSASATKATTTAAPTADEIAASKAKHDAAVQAQADYWRSRLYPVKAKAKPSGAQSNGKQTK